MPARTPLPPLRAFAARRFAVRGPLVSWVACEPVGGVLAWAAGVIGLSPSAVTLLGGLSGVAGGVVLGMAADIRAVWLAVALLLLAYCLDCADGQLARATSRTSDRGAWLDVTVDAVVTVVLTVSLAHALASDGGQAPWSFLVAGVFGASRVVNLITWVQVRGLRTGGPSSPGAASLAKTVYGAVVDTPFVYALLCASRLHPTPFRAVILALAAMTAVGTVLQATRHLTGPAQGTPPYARRSPGTE